MLFEVKLIINNLPLTYVPQILSKLFFQHRIKCKLPKNKFNDVMLVYDEKVSRPFWGIAIVTGVLLSRDSETKRSDSENQKGQCNLQTYRNQTLPN